MPCICLLLAPLGLLQLPGLGVLKGARLRVWWSGFHHVAVEPLDVARSKDLTNTPNWVYFGVFPVDLGTLHVVVRAVVVLCRKSGGAVLRTPFLPRCRAARDLTGPLYPVVAWGQASGPSRPITPIQCIGLRSRCRHQTRAPVLKLTRDPRRHPYRPGAETGLTKSSRGARALLPGTPPQPPWERRRVSTASPEGIYISS
jgi:hypothetical protein